MKSRKRLLWAIFWLYFFAVLWITLFSRIGTSVRQVYPPFWSYKAILQSDNNALVETIENIMLFFPLGYGVVYLFKLKKYQAIVIGFLLSLLIESAQWVFMLGSTEIDDTINNTIGTAIGALCVIQDRSKRIRYITIIGVFVLCVGVMINVCRIDNSRKMILLASNWDRVDGYKNLLILNGISEYVGSSNIYVAFLEDGRIKISGTSEIRAWKLIGEIVLSPGLYCFSGLSDIERNTIALELEYFNTERNTYIRLTPDVGPLDEVLFFLEEDTRIKAYVSIYPGAKCDVIACPVIFQKEY